ncbi:MAG: hypothetical protein ACI8P0_004329, partial [Planctomycetaceae bacterium]
MARSHWLNTLRQRLASKSRRARDNRASQLQPGAVERLENRALLTAAVSFAGNILTINVGADGETVILSEDGNDNLSITSNDVGGTTADVAAQALGFSATSAQNAANTGIIAMGNDVRQIVISGAGGTQTIDIQGGTFTAVTIGPDIEDVIFSTAASSFEDVSGLHGNGNLAVSASNAISIGEDISVTDGNQFHDGAVVLTDNVTLSTTGADSDITFQSTVDADDSTSADRTLILNSENTDFIGNVGESANGQLASLSIVADEIFFGSNINVNDADAVATAVSLTGDVILTANTSITSDAITANGPISAEANDLSLTSDEIDLTGGANSVSGMGMLTLAPFTESESVGINGGAGTLDLSTADLDALMDGFSLIQLGSPTGTGLVTVNAVSFDDPVIISGGSFALVGAISGGNDATIDLNRPAGNDDTLTVDLDGTALRLNDGTTDLLNVVAATAGFNGLSIDGGDGDDTLTVDFTNGNPLPANGLTFDGGTQATGTGDALVITGNAAPFTTQTITFTGSNSQGGGTGFDGSIDLDSSVITFTGLEPITGGTSANTVLTLPNVANPDAVLQNNTTQGGTGAGFIEITGTMFENTVIPNPTTSLTINLGTMNDSLTINSLDTAFDADVTITGAAGTDTVRVATALDTGTGESLTISGVETVDVDAQISADSGITFTAPTTTNLGANLQTDGGNVSITGGAVVVDAASVTIDTESSGAVNGGNVDFTGVSSISADAASRDLTINADSAFGTGTGGTVTLPVFDASGGANVDDLAVSSDSNTDGTINLGGNITTTSTIGLNNTSGIVLLADSELAGTTVNVGAGISGAFTLTLDGSTSVNVDGAITTTNFTTDTAITVDSINIAGSLSVNGGTLTVNNGNATIGGNATTTQAIALTAAASTIRVNGDASLGGNVTATGDIDLNDANGVVLTADTELDGDNVDVESGVSGAFTLTLDGATSVDVGGAITTQNLTTDTAATVDSINIAGNLSVNGGTLTV